MSMLTRAVTTIGPNILARAVALVAVAGATVLVARAGGPAEVGTYVLLRVLPGLVAVVCACGLPGAVGYFLGGPARHRPRLWASLLAVMAAGSLLGAAVWLMLTPALHHTFFPTMPVGLVAAMAVTIVTQLPVAAGKAALQGMGDSAGSNLAIAAEELAFLPAYAVLLAAGLAGPTLLVVALTVADLVVAVGIAARIRRRGGLIGPWRPEPALVRTVCAYGMRGQVGGLVLLLNLRLDFALLGWMAGPAVLGVYAVASKFAELLRLPGQAATWVLYPRFAGDTRAERVRATGRMLQPALLLTVAAAVPLALSAPLVVPLLYGSAFRTAIPLVWILVVGLCADGPAGVLSAYLYGAGAPGRNSFALGCGLVVTATLDLALIPTRGAVGAALASAVAYLTTSGTLFALYRAHARRMSRTLVLDPVVTS